MASLLCSQIRLTCSQCAAHGFLLSQAVELNVKKEEKKKRKKIIDDMDAAFVNTVRDKIFRYLILELYRDAADVHAGDLSRPTRTPSGVKITCLQRLIEARHHKCDRVSSENYTHQQVLRTH